MRVGAAPVRAGREIDRCADGQEHLYARHPLPVALDPFSYLNSHHPDAVFADVVSQRHQQGIGLSGHIGHPLFLRFIL
jgi:hypothetical protein